MREWRKKQKQNETGQRVKKERKYKVKDRREWRKTDIKEGRDTERDNEGEERLQK